MVQKGDTVVMHDCGEAKHYEGVVWTCRTNEWGENEGRGVYEQRLVMLEGFSGSFHTKYLRKVEVTDDNTVICEGCDKVILADSKGYEVYLESEGAYCIQCEKEKGEQLQAQAFVHNAMNEINGVTHTVFKNADLEGAKKHFKGINVVGAAAHVGKMVREYRESESKNPNPQYIVINTDEDPRMIKEIIEVMKRYEMWGDGNANA